MEYNFYNKSILEIGVGPGTTFAAIKLILSDRLTYIGTDTSQEYVNFVSDTWKMKTVQTDITHLPGKNKSYDYIVALDVLEHVEPKFRLAGYDEINRVLKNDGRIILNTTKNIEPDSEAYHWGFFGGDLTTLINACSLYIEKREAYEVMIPEIKEVRHYEFFVGRRK